MAHSSRMQPPAGWDSSEENDRPPTSGPVLVVEAFQDVMQQEGELRREDIAPLVTAGFLEGTPDLEAMRRQLAPYRATFQRPEPLSGTWVEVDICRPP